METVNYQEFNIEGRWQRVALTNRSKNPCSDHSIIRQNNGVQSRIKALSVQKFHRRPEDEQTGLGLACHYSALIEQVHEKPKELQPRR